jgi:hypothetical protein
VLFSFSSHKTAYSEASNFADSPPHQIILGGQIRSAGWTGTYRMRPANITVTEKPPDKRPLDISIDGRII